MDTDEVQFVDAETYSGGKKKDALSFREICLQHLRRITLLGSKEFVGGYFKDVTKAMGGMTMTDKTYVADTRQEYVNAVDVLYDLLLPHFDKRMQTVAKEIELQLEAVRKEYQREKDEKGATHRYRNNKLEVKRKLFQELSCFLNRIRYLEAETFEDVI